MPSSLSKYCHNLYQNGPEGLAGTHFFKSSGDEVKIARQRNSSEFFESPQDDTISVNLSRLDKNQKIWEEIRKIRNFRKNQNNDLTSSL